MICEEQFMDLQVLKDTLNSWNLIKVFLQFETFTRSSSLRKQKYAPRKLITACQCSVCELRYDKANYIIIALLERRTWFIWAILGYAVKKDKK